jgi:NitT/TauT family transport system substrate-binding protein
MVRGTFARWGVVAALGAILAGCGGGGSGGGNSNGPATLKVGVLPITDVAPLYLGIKQGYFKHEKLTIKPQVMQGGAEVTAAIVSGNLDIGFSSVEPLMIARSKNIPVKIVSQGVQAAPSTAQSWDGLMVKGNGPIHSPKDLEGKTIAVNALKNMNELAVRTVLTRDGVDASKIKFIEVPFPDMPAAVQTGRVDAATAVEPFVTASEAAGSRKLLSFFAGMQPKMTIATYFASTPYIGKHAGVVRRLIAAMKQSLEYAQTDHAAVRQIVGSYTKIPATVAQKMNLPYWSAGLNRPSIDLTAAATQRFGYTKAKVGASQLIWSGAAAG